MENKGHTELCHDLSELLSEAHAFEFHDFKNTKYAMPKMKLVLKLGAIMQKVKDGDYDN